MAKAKNLKMHHQFDIAPGVVQTVYEVADSSKPVEFPALNYAAAAKDSFRQFVELKKAGKIAAGTKFQVSLPTAVAVMSGFIVPESQGLVEKPYAEALKKELEEIVQSIPHQELAIQWDVCHEVLSWKVGNELRRPVEGRTAQEDRRSRKRSPVRHRSRIPIFATGILGTSICWSPTISAFRSSWRTPSSTAVVAQ